MGGTGRTAYCSVMDQVFSATARQPGYPGDHHHNPDPQSGTLNLYTARKQRSTAPIRKRNPASSPS